MDEQVVVPSQTHSGEVAMNEPPARSQLLPSYDRAMGMNKPFSICNVNVHNDPTPLVLSMAMVVGAVILNGVFLPIVLGHVSRIS